MKAHATEKKLSVILLFTLAFLLLSIVPLYRLFFYEGFAPGYTYYYHMRIGSYMLNHGIPPLDPAVTSITSYYFDWFDLITGITQIFHETYGVLFLPFILGIMTLFFFTSLLAQHTYSSRYILLAGIFFISCPLCLTIFTEPSSLGFIAFLLAGGMYFFFKKNNWHYLAYFFFPLLSVYTLFHSIIIIGFLFCFGYKQKKEVWILSSIISIISIALFFYRGQVIQIQIPALLILIQQLFSDVGGTLGLSIFGILLAVQGITACQTPKKYIFLGTGILFFSFIISPFYLLYLLPLLAKAMTDGFFSLLERKWSLQYLQNITLFLLMLGILFSTTSAISRIAISGPSLQTIHALEWLEKNSYSNAIILTDKQRGFMVEYLTHRRVIADKHTLFENIPPEIYDMYLIKNSEEILLRLEKYQIDYLIFFSNTADDPAFLKTRENFKKILETNDIRIWSVYY